MGPLEDDDVDRVKGTGGRAVGEQELGNLRVYKGRESRERGGGHGEGEANREGVEKEL